MRSVTMATKMKTMDAVAPVNSRRSSTKTSTTINSMDLYPIISRNLIVRDLPLRHRVLLLLSSNLLHHPERDLLTQHLIK
jgi:hypothetical protein